LGTWGYAYVIKIGDTGLYKLGHTNDLNARIETYYTIATERLSWYEQIESDDCPKVEAVMKDYLEEFRVPRLNARELFRPPQTELDQAIAVAKEWNDVMLPLIAVAKLVEGQECDPDLVLEPTEEHWSMYRELLRLRQIERRSLQGQERIKRRLQVDMGRASSLDGIATWKSEFKAKFDRKGFVKKYPHLEPFIDEFITRPHSRRFLPRW
jgi:hypothetical protein